MKSQASLDREIISDVGIVIKIDKLMSSQIAVSCQRGYDQEQAGYYLPAPVLHGVSYLNL